MKEEASFRCHLGVPGTAEHEFLDHHLLLSPNHQKKSGLEIELPALLSVQIQDMDITGVAFNISAEVHLSEFHSFLGGQGRVPRLESSFADFSCHKQGAGSNVEELECEPAPI